MASGAMTAVVADPGAISGVRPERRVAPLPPWPTLVRAALMMVCAVSCLFVAYLVLVTPLQQRSAQQRLYDRFRGDLARGTAPISASGLEGRSGDPVAYLEIPSIGLRQVVVEGTSGATLASGPGHRRDTALPGLAGTSVVMGRRWTHGSPFRDLSELHEGALVHVTSGAGVIDYRVRGVRRSGESAPRPVGSDRSRLVLATAEGGPFFPSGVVLVDADSVEPPLGSARPAVAAGSLTSAERPMGTDGSTLWRLSLWLEALVAAVLAAAWGWRRWHPAKTWIVALPAVALVGYEVAGEASRLLPNLL